MTAIVVFTVHKAGSMFLHRLLEQVTKTAGLNYYSPNFPGSPFYFPEAKKNNDEEIYERCSEKLTGCVGPLRRPLRFKSSIDARYILHLRDPRDVLTSMYFSYCYSHVGIDYADKVFWIKEGVDKFVLDRADDFLERYSIYCTELLGKPNVTHLKYEEMVTTFDRWLEKFIPVFPLHDKEAFIKILLAQYKDEFKVASEDASQHKRRILPGDHRDKLRSETTEILTHKFRDVLQMLVY